MLKRYKDINTNTNTNTNTNYFSEHTREEMLDEANSWYCNVCKKHQRAKKIIQFHKGNNNTNNHTNTNTNTNNPKKHYRRY